MSRFPSGFTLLELLVAVAIVGLVAAIAIPSYRDYVVKAKVSEMILAGANAKIAIAESTQIQGNLNDAGSGVSIGTEGKYLSTAIVSSDGVITLTALAAALGTANDVTLVLTPKLETSGVLTWTCSGQGSQNHLPASCR